MVSFEVHRPSSLAWAFVLAGFAGASGVFAQPLDAPVEDIKERLAEQIRHAQAQQGPYSRELIEPLKALSVLYEEGGQHSLATALVEQARQVMRANYGLRTLEQAPLIGQRILSEEARGNFAEAWDLEQALLSVARANPNDLRAAPIFREIGDKRMALLERYLTGGFLPQIALGCYYALPSRSSPSESNGSCHSGSRSVASARILADAQRNYANAIEVLLRQQAYSSDELRELELALARSSYRYGGQYHTGRQSLVRLVSYDVANGAPLRKRVDSLLQVADWDLMFEHRDLALDTYAKTYALLQSEGLAQESIDAMFAPRTPIALPAFLPNPLASDAPQGSANFVDVAFDITRFGASGRIEILDSTSGASEAAKDRLVRAIHGSRFRPRVIDGEIARTARIVIRHYLNEQAFRRPAALKWLVDLAAADRFATRAVVMAPHGMVATSQPLATEIGVATLRSGGSAVDAAIAANAALGLMEPTGCGIGGDLFAIVWEAAHERLHGLNASGRSPLSLTGEVFARAGLATIPERGPLSVSVPGAVDGWFELHARFGRLPMRELLAPSIDYARTGFPLTEVIGAAWAAGADTLRDSPGFAAVFMPNGRAPAVGERFANPALARAYEALASDGREAFYGGPLAEAVEQAVRRNGGFLGREDLAAHRSEWVEPVSTTYRGWHVYELPPNGQGIAVLQMLNILEGFDLASLDWGSAEHLHLLIEAKKLAFEDRAHFYADPQFATIPVERLIAKDYAEVRRALIDPKLAAPAPTHGASTLGAGDTVYLAAADAAGNMVSLIQSNYMGFGSGVTVAPFGFGLQNRGSQFALESQHANAYRPGKRPFHTIIPGFAVRDGDALLAFGVMGAAMQPQGQVQVLSNLVDFGMGLQAAGDAPRVRHEGSTEPTGVPLVAGGGTVHLEPGFDADAVEGLRARGHRIEPAGPRGAFGGYQAIRHDLRRAVYRGASESRKDGHAAGF
jgi:gamma-glutamyltranspeptidase/glutathione hydrolase